MHARTETTNRNPPKMDEIRIGQINLARSRVATEEIAKYAIQNGLDVLQIQEPYTHKDRVTGLGTGIKIAQAEHGTPWVAVAILRDDFTVVHLEHTTTTRIACIHLSTEDIRINLVSLYCKVSRAATSDMRRSFRELSNALKQINEDGVIVGMDANAKSTTWHSNNSDVRGRKLEEFIAQNGLRVINREQEQSTFQVTCGESNIDVTLTRGCRNIAISNWTVMDGVTQSDHNLITFTIRSTRNNLRIEPNTTEMPSLRFRIDERRSKQLRARIVADLTGSNAEPRNVEEIDKAVEKLTKAILKACTGTFRLAEKTDS